jgi:hypothetical protein
MLRLWIPGSTKSVLIRQLMEPIPSAAPPPLIYRPTKNLRAVQLLLGHTKLESTVRYLDIEVEDALELAEETEA